MFTIDVEVTYTSQLTKDSPIYARVCGKGKYHYEIIEVNVEQNGSYRFKSNSTIELFGYIYRNEIYILVITTIDPNMRGSFTLLVYGANNITLKELNKKHSMCTIGDQCNLYSKGIGLTINDILRNQIQSILIESAGGITIIMFLTGFINGIFSLITFQSKEVRRVGQLNSGLLFSFNCIQLLTHRSFEQIVHSLIYQWKILQILNMSLNTMFCVLFGILIRFKHTIQSLYFVI